MTELEIEANLMLKAEWDTIQVSVLYLFFPIGPLSLFTPREVQSTTFSFISKFFFFPLKESGKKLTPLYGEGYTGMINLGNR